MLDCGNRHLPMPPVWSDSGSDVTERGESSPDLIIRSVNTGWGRGLIDVTCMAQLSKTKWTNM